MYGSKEEQLTQTEDVLWKCFNFCWQPLSGKETVISVKPFTWINKGEQQENHRSTCVIPLWHDAANFRCFVRVCQIKDASQEKVTWRRGELLYQSSSCAERAHYRLTLECLRLHLLLVEGYEMQAWGKTMNRTWPFYTCWCCHAFCNIRL